MRSFLSIISKKSEYPDLNSILKAIGMDPDKEPECSVLGFSSRTVFLSSGKPRNKSHPVPCFIESERYYIQHDVKVFNDQAPEAFNKLLKPATVKGLFADPEKVNALPFEDFHLLIWDKSELKLLAFRDPIGVWPLYYYVNENWLIISTDVAIIRSLDAVNLIINEEWIADSLVNLHSAASKTYYSNIHLIKPGHVLLSDYKREVLIPYYNLISNKKTITNSPEDAHEIFRIKLNDAIEKRVKGFVSVGSELSGGLDSSALVSFAYPITLKSKTEFHTFSNVLPERERIHSNPRKYESYYGTMVVNELGISNHHSLFGEGLGVLEELKVHVKTMGMPTQQLFTMFSDELYKEVSAFGLTQLLSGFGGDECVSNNGSGFFEEMAYDRNWVVFLREMKSSSQRQNKPLIRGYSNYILQRYVPFGKDLSTWIKKKTHWKDQKIRNFGFDQQFGKNMKLQSRYLAGKGELNEASIRERQYRRLIHPYVSRRLIGSHQVSVKHGFSYAFPLLDRDLLEFHLSLPATYKYNNGIGRILLREALKGILPDEIRLRTDKQGAVVPTVRNRLRRDEDTIKRFIKHSQATNRYHYIDYQRLLEWLQILLNQNIPKGVFTNPNAFYNSLQILLLQEMERTGEFKTGIYC